MFQAMERAHRPENLSSLVAFAALDDSGHYFCIDTKGRIFLTNHENLSADEFAASFDEFLSSVCTDPGNLLGEETGGYVRDSDGSTVTDWFPVEYVPDVGAKRRKHVSRKR